MSPWLMALALVAQPPGPPPTPLPPPQIRIENPRVPPRVFCYVEKNLGHLAVCKTSTGKRWVIV